MAKFSFLLLASFVFFLAQSQQKATITINAAKAGAKVSPTLHGIFFEEISHGGEGDLYAELIQNRDFEESRLPGFKHSKRFGIRM
jgi:hypothetical protein